MQTIDWVGFYLHEEEKECVPKGICPYCKGNLICEEDYDSSDRLCCPNCGFEF